MGGSEKAFYNKTGGGVPKTISITGVWKKSRTTNTVLKQRPCMRVNPYPYSLGRIRGTVL